MSRIYDWTAVQAYYNEGHPLTECMQRFGFCREAWHKAVKRRQMIPRPLGRPLQALLVTGKSRTNIKRRLKRAGLLQERCEECGLTEWLGEHLSIQIDHINGVRNDHRLENLRMLCPNCHSQTETYGRRNGKRTELQESAGTMWYKPSR